MTKTPPKRRYRFYAAVCNLPADEEGGFYWFDDAGGVDHNEPFRLAGELISRDVYNYYSRHYPGSVVTFTSEFPNSGFGYSAMQDKRFYFKQRADGTYFRAVHLDQLDLKGDDNE